MWRSPRPELGDLRGPLGDAGGLWSALAWLGVGALGLGAILATLALVLVGARLWDPERRRFDAVNAWWGRSVLMMFPGAVELRGMAHLERSAPAIIAPNHQSMVDLLVLYRLPVPYRTVVKRSWFRSPFGLNLWGAGYVPTPRRGDPVGPGRVVEACAGWLERGVSVLIFPEGTRSRAWQVQRFKRGAFELAVRTGRPVVPVAVAGTNDVSHPSSLRFTLRPRKIIVEALPPEAPGEDWAELRDRCRARLAARVDALRAELAAAGQGPT